MNVNSEIKKLLLIFQYKKFSLTNFIYLFRDRRMFGALLGTLQKFRQEETQLKDKVSCITTRIINS